MKPSPCRPSKIKPKIILVLLGTAVLSLMDQSAQAEPITGSIGFSGSGFGTTSSGTSTLTFNNPMFVDIRTSDYLGVPSGTATSFASISWIGMGTGAVLTSMNSPQWSIMIAGTTYSFNLLSLDKATINGAQVALSGRGEAFISGAMTRDPTPANFSVQGSGSGSFSFALIQSSTSATRVPVPEGGSAIILLGMGAAAVEVLRRKLRSPGHARS